MNKINWFDMLIYRLFYWRWRKLLKERSDLREMMISWLKAYDVVDENQQVKIKVIIEKQGD